MAQHVETHLVDDIDGGPAAGTVTFSVDGKTFREVDLNDENAKRFHEATEPFLAASRPATKAASASSGRRSAGGNSPRASTADRERNKAVRAWARSKGMDVAERGRLGEDIVEAHERAGYPATSGSENGAPSFPLDAQAATPALAGAPG